MNRPLALHRYAPRHRAARETKGFRITALALCVPLAASAGLGTVTSAAAATPSRLADTSGALAVGSAGYAVPAGAIFVSTAGSDSYTGTQTKPVRTVARAIALAASGGTVVLRKGTYHETVTVTKKVTIQNYPKEAAWLDGSVSVSGWVKDGNAWRHDKWTPRFDASVGFTKGDRDGTSPGWQYVNPAYPMAAHPDQLFRSGVQQRQVASRSAVGAGKFFLDTATSKLYLGSDPAGRSIRGTTLAKAMSIRAAGTVVRGIGIKNYAPSIWHIGAVTVESPSVRIENVVIQDTATIGLGIIASDAIVNRTSVVRAGLLGVHAATADRLQVLRSRLDGNNWERFNSAPVSGGIKVGRSRGVLVKDSSVSKNLGHGYWSDVSVYDTKLVNSNFNQNSATGVFLEISARGTVVNNLIYGNGAEGIKVNNTSTVLIYNNTVLRNARPINIVQDSRTKANTSYGDDTRYPNDPEMTWLVGPVTLRNNVIGLPNDNTNCVLCVEDYTHQRTAAQMGVTSNGNVFNRDNTSDPNWLTVWSRGTTNVNPAVYSSLAAHRSGTGQDKTSVAYNGSYAVTSTGHLSGTTQAQAGSIATGLPSSLATLTGESPGEKWLGVWGR
ncbi:parallel beta-helix repeat (two copies) [Pedococcus dokdonensis]|uniref:Parallel beta-helix repeat (Two copies) n=1 Tax=Pedococcus dokdonensis TaxID=443156 RepID=A0A1H0T7D3_9MICO|nr:right-handed parallel beta-helix repeat-containing protein [Pedococcus dokdonensis]SDP49508.1 parallel beta-helix repeat (two copies) [Pedococcus dokdonensis]